MSENPQKTRPSQSLRVGTTRYPPPCIPLTPPISWSSLGKTLKACPSLLDIKHVPVSSGRAAITLALQHAAIGANDEVLVPAYHCESMIAPVEHVGATPVYYKVQGNTNVDVEDIESKISPKTQAMIATHYFGFPQLITELRSLCNRHALLLIEDCAHAFFGAIQGRPMGSFGDYAIGSAMKFFPLFDGGLLASNTRDLSAIELFQPSVMLELKGSVSVIEYAMRYGRLQFIGPALRLAIKGKDLMWGVAKKAMGHKGESRIAPSSSEGGYALEPQWINARMSRLSQFILKHSEVDRICETRRRNYATILNALQDTPGIEPLFPSLPHNSVPLVVPMIVHNPLEVFPRLKLAGVPIWRFGEYLDPEVTEEVCASSVFLSQHIFQFPCHSELTDEEIQWMVDTINQHMSV